MSWLSTRLRHLMYSKSPSKELVWRREAFNLIRVKHSNSLLQLTQRSQRMRKWEILSSRVQSSRKRSLGWRPLCFLWVQRFNTTRSLPCSSVIETMLGSHSIPSRVWSIFIHQKSKGLSPSHICLLRRPKKVVKARFCLKWERETINSSLRKSRSSKSSWSLITEISYHKG